MSRQQRCTRTMSGRMASLRVTERPRNLCEWMPFWGSNLVPTPFSAAMAGGFIDRMVQKKGVSLFNPFWINHCWDYMVIDIIIPRSQDLTTSRPIYSVRKPRSLVAHSNLFGDQQPSSSPTQLFSTKASLYKSIMLDIARAVIPIHCLDASERFENTCDPWALKADEYGNATSNVNCS